MLNPYWHPESKPHVVDLDEVRALCVGIYSIVRASAANAGDGMRSDDADNEDVISSIENLHFELAEQELSIKLLRLAVLIRTYDDVMCASAEESIAESYRQHRDQIDADAAGYGGVNIGPNDQLSTLRRCANKIIHANDVRPVYQTEDSRDDPDARWGMTSELELEGSMNGQEWGVCLFLFNFLEAAVDLIAPRYAVESGG